MDLYVVNCSAGALPLYVEVYDASIELRPQMTEGAANARGPFTLKADANETQFVGRFAAATSSSLGFAVFLFLQQRGGASFERINVPAATKKAIVKFDGSTRHVQVYKDCELPREPAWMKWIWLSVVALVIVGGAAFVIYKCVATAKSRALSAAAAAAF